MFYTRQEFNTPPSFIHPPLMEGYFQGCGWGCIEFAHKKKPYLRKL